MRRGAATRDVSTPRGDRAPRRDRGLRRGPLPDPREGPALVATVVAEGSSFPGAALPEGVARSASPGPSRRALRGRLGWTVPGRALTRGPIIMTAYLRTSAERRGRHRPQLSAAIYDTFDRPLARASEHGRIQSSRPRHRPIARPRPDKHDVGAAAPEGSPGGSAVGGTMDPHGMPDRRGIRGHRRATRTAERATGAPRPSGRPLSNRGACRPGSPSGYILRAEPGPRTISAAADEPGPAVLDRTLGARRPHDV